MLSMFNGVEMGPPDAILGIKVAYRADASPDKLDCGIGAYRDENGKPYVLNVVKIAEARIAADDSRTKEYLTQAGDPEFVDLTRKFLFGAEAKSIAENRCATVQALSGTGALRVGGDFLAKNRPCTVFVPNPTWGNHKAIFKSCGLKVSEYRYFDQKTLGLDVDGMLEDVSKMPVGSVIVLHVCSHNPTGVDPSQDQWRLILDAVRKAKVLPFFDNAYQGFASGDVDVDAFSVRLFESENMELMCAQSYSKNVGLYGERIGALNVITSSPEVSERVLSRLKISVRAMYSNPPRHGAAIVKTILGDPLLLNDWKIELKSMVDRIQSMRVGLRSAVERAGAKGDWSFMTKQIGMFTYTPLTKEMVSEMASKHHVYMTSNGRISLAGLTTNRLEYLGKAIADVYNRSSL